MPRGVLTLTPWRLLACLVAWLQEGLAHVCLVGSTCTLTRAKIEANIPRKRGAAAAGYDKAIESFYDKVFQVGWGVGGQTGARVPLNVSIPTAHPLRTEIR